MINDRAATLNRYYLAVWWSVMESDVMYHFTQILYGTLGLVCYISGQSVCSETRN